MAIVTGTNDPDTLNGTAADDQIDGLEGNDTLNGGEANDLLNGGGGNDRILTGNGQDTVHAGPGDDEVNGYLSDTQNGAYQYWAYNGDKRINGGLGQDFLLGGSGHDQIYGDEDNDRLYGQEGHDSLYGGEGDDRLEGNDGDDRLYGDAGHDFILTGQGNDQVFGGEGNDSINGHPTDDTGAYQHYANTGAQMLSGGNGDDFIVGGSEADQLAGDAGHDRLYGRDGHDTILGGEGNDTLEGGEGNDTLEAGKGVDLAKGGAGDDHYRIQSPSTHIDDSSGTDSAYVEVNYVKLPSTIENITYAPGVEALPYWIDALVADDGNGHYFRTLLGTSPTLYYAFPTTAPGYYSDPETRLNGWEPINAAQRLRIEEALTYLEGLVGLEFIETSNVNQQNALVFANNTQSGSAAYAFHPSTSFAGNDVFINKGIAENLEMAEGSNALLTLIHEIGHAIGLKHPFVTQDASGDVAEPPYLPGAEDNTTWTVMSYTKNVQDYALTLKPLDIAALHYLYGPSLTARTGNDIYVFDPLTANFVWDGAGVDTLSFAQATQGVSASLEPGVWSYMGSQKATNISAAGQLSVNFGTLIENASGSSFDDVLTGNAADNVLKGAGGNDALHGGPGRDTLWGGGGADTLYGGEGEDTAAYLDARDQYQVAFDADLNAFLIEHLLDPSDSDVLYDIAFVRFAAEEYAIASLTESEPPPPTPWVVNGMGGRDIYVGTEQRDYFWVSGDGASTTPMEGALASPSGSRVTAMGGDDVFRISAYGPTPWVAPALSLDGGAGFDVVGVAGEAGLIWDLTRLQPTSVEALKLAWRAPEGAADPNALTVKLTAAQWSQFSQIAVDAANADMALIIEVDGVAEDAAEVAAKRTVFSASSDPGFAPPPAAGAAHTLQGGAGRDILLSVSPGDIPEAYASAPRLMIGQDLAADHTFDIFASGARFGFHNTELGRLGDLANAAGVTFARDGLGRVSKAPLLLPNGQEGATSSYPLGALLVGNPEIGWSSVFATNADHGLGAAYTDQVGRQGLRLQDLFAEPLAHGTPIFFTYHDTDTNNPGQYDIRLTITSPETFTLSGRIYHWKTQALLDGYSLQIRDPQPTNAVVAASLSATDGRFAVADLLAGTYALEASKPITDRESGGVVSSADALAALKIAVGRNPNTDPDGVLGPLEPLPVSPYQFIAADVNADGKVTSADALAILKMAVRRNDAPAREWVFVDEKQSFWSGAGETGLAGFSVTRQAVPRPEALTAQAQVSDDTQQNLVAVLKGDVNASWVAPENSPVVSLAYFIDLEARDQAPLAQWGLYSPFI